VVIGGTDAYMPTAKLTDTQCRAAKPRDKPYKLFDGGGLALVVLPSGVKSWRLFHRVAGKQQTTTLGLYPAVGAAEARRRAQEARQRPAVAAAVPVPTLTLADACNAYWQARRDLTPGYQEQERRRLEFALFPELGKTPVAELTRAEVLRVLLTIDARGKAEAARRTLRGLGQVLDWCVELEHCAVNVAKTIKPARAFSGRKVEHHASLPLAEVPAFMARIALEPELQSVLAFKLLALTWVRTGELRAMRWMELERDADGTPTRWRVPAERMKMRRGVDHLVPLSTQAVQLLAVLQQRAGRSPFVFPAERTPERPMSEAAVLALIGRMGYAGRMTGHGVRTWASTWSNENGWHPDAIERQLAHMPGDAVRAAYNAAQHLPERVRMMQAWADWLLPALAP
jgi:integrase